MARSSDAEAVLSIDDYLCLALHTAARAMNARYRPLLDPLGLTYPQYLVVVLLGEDGPATVGQLGDRLALDSNTVSPLLKRLEARRLVTRNRDPGDDRVIIVALTAKGRALLKKAADVPRQICAASGLGDGSRDALTQQLRDMAASLAASTRSATSA